MSHQTFHPFFSLRRVKLKKGPRGRLALETSFRTKIICIRNEGPWKFFGDKMSYSSLLFCSYLRQISGDQAENFTTVFPLQPQHILQISAHLYCPGLRSTFEGEGGLKILFCFILMLFILDKDVYLSLNKSIYNTYIHCSYIKRYTTLLISTCHRLLTFILFGTYFSFNAKFSAFYYC